MTTKKFLSEIEAAEFLCCSVAKMQRDRRLGSKIPYVKIGRSVRYRLADLERYVEQQTYTSTVQYGKGVQNGR